MEEQTSTIKDDYKVNVEKLPGCHTIFTAEISPKKTQELYRQALKLVNKEISVPGFRKGKAPESFIKEKFSQSIEQEWKNLLLNEAFNAGLRQTGLKPFNGQSAVKSAKVEKLDSENGATCVIAFEAMPEVPSIDPSILHVEPIEKQAVGQEQIDSFVKEIQHYHTTWEPITERGIELGDYADLKILNLDAAEEVICEDTRFEIKDDQMGKWLYDKLLGKKAGESFEAVSEMSTDECSACKTGEGEHAHPQGFKQTNCRVEVLKVLKGILPEVNDDLAKKVGAKDKEDLLKNVARNLENRADQEKQDAVRAQIEEQILEKYTFEVPDSLVEEEKKAKYNMAVARKAQEKGSALTSEERKEIEANVKDEAKAAYRFFYLIDKAARENHIQVTEKDLTQEMVKLSMQDPYWHQQASEDEIRKRTFFNVLSHKTLDLLSEKAAAKPQ